MTVSSRKTSKLLSLAAGIALALVGSVGTMTPRPAQAQLAVACVNCSDIFTQLLEYSEQLLQYAKQIQEYNLQLQQYADQVRNSVKVPFAVFDNALGKIRQIESMMDQGFNMRYTMYNINAEFQRLYPDVFTTYNNLREVRDVWQAMGQSWERQLQTYDSARTALIAARDHSFSLQDDQYRMDQVAWHVTDASGRLDALQAAGEYAQQSAQQLMKLRQVALVQLQMAANVQADQQRKENLARAAQQIWIEDRPNTPLRTGNGSSDYRR